MFCAPELFFDGTVGVGSRFHVFRARTRFRQYRGRRVPFSCFACTDSCSAVPMASGPVFMFYAPEHVFCDIDGSRFHVLQSRTRFRWYSGVGYRFHVLCARTRFRWYRGRRVPFHVLRARTHFRWYRWRRVPFSCFALPDTFSAVSRVSGNVLIFCAPGLAFGGTKGVSYHFNVFLSLNIFRRYPGRRF
jgi:hypothetical protein